MDTGSRRNTVMLAALIVEEEVVVTGEGYRRLVVDMAVVEVFAQQEMLGLGCIQAKAQNCSCQVGDTEE